MNSFSSGSLNAPIAARPAVMNDSAGETCTPAITPTTVAAISDNAMKNLANIFTRLSQCIQVLRTRFSFSYNRFTSLASSCRFGGNSGMYGHCSCRAESCDLNLSRTKVSISFAEFERRFSILLECQSLLKVRLMLILPTESCYRPNNLVIQNFP